MGKDNAGVESQPIQTLRTDWAPLPHKVSDVFLSFDLDVDRTVVRSVLSMERNLESSERGEIRLDAVELEILSVSFDGEELSEGPRGWSHDGAVLRVHRDPDGAFEIRTECAIRPKENTALEGLYASGSMLVTQCEAEGFRRISPFPDRPDATARFQVELTADPDRFPVLLSNGNPAG